MPVVVLSAIVLWGCNDDNNSPETLRFSPEMVVVEAGSSTTASILNGKEPFAIASSDESKATVKLDGRTIAVTGVSEGQLLLTVTDASHASAKLAVVVNGRPAGAPVLSATTADLEVGGSMTVTISGGQPIFTATSNNAAVTPTVDGNTLLLTGVSEGTAIVTVKGSDNASATIAVTVNDEQILFGPDKKQFGNGNQRFFIRKSHTLKKGVYTMVGWIYVEEGATLTIEPGTIIKGTDYNYDGRQSATGSSLIIKRGAKIYAEGTPTDPVVFTSAQPKGKRQATDWGGIIICGKARNNQGEMTIEGGVEADHGGNDDNDNSGTLRYVRIEFAGYPYALDNEINGLTLGSVGSKTTIDHVQVSYSGDDSFEWFGGTVNAKYLIAYHGWDDDFDTDNGFTGKLQFLLGVRDPKIADQSNANGFESDNNANGTTQTPVTGCIFSNVTIIGPLEQDPNFSNVASSGGYVSGYNWGVTTGAPFPIRTGIFQAAMQIRRNSHLSCFNAVFAGFPVGIMLSNDGRGDTQGAAAGNLLKVKNVVIAGVQRLGADTDKKDPTQWSGEISANYFGRTDLHNRLLPDIAALKLKQPNSKQLPLASAGYAANDLSVNWGPMSGSPLLGTADFDDALLSDPFFSKVNYIGAFAGDSDTDNWTKGWANFDPQNTDY